jgi:glutamate-1-semialdehyde aminotransferase
VKNPHVSDAAMALYRQLGNGVFFGPLTNEEVTLAEELRSAGLAEVAHLGYAPHLVRMARQETKP